MVSELLHGELWSSKTLEVEGSSLHENERGGSQLGFLSLLRKQK